MTFLKKMTTYAACLSLLLSGCVTTGGGGGGTSTTAKVGPAYSSAIEQEAEVAQEPVVQGARLDIIVPVFDPGLPEDPDDLKEKGVWPELRRAEANRFAQKLKLALDKTNAFGAVRVAPDTTATGDVYAIGKIERSDGKYVGISLELHDVAGNDWGSESFEHEVSSNFHQDIRNKGKDPYDPLFDEAAEYVVEQMLDRSVAERDKLKQIAELRFAASLSEAEFAQYLKQDGREFDIAALPSAEDPAFTRMKTIRIRDQLFVDRLQEHYFTFTQEMSDSYAIWQEQSLVEVEAEEEADARSTRQAVFGFLALALGVAAGVAGASSGSQAGQSLGTLGAIGGGIAGFSLIGRSFQTSEEAKVHRDALQELGRSIDVEIAPQVVAFEGETKKLTGDAKEQFAQWRKFLAQIHALEATPDKQL